MLFNSNLNISPRQASKIKKIKPERAFKRILYFLTAGAISDKLEEQTFTAVSILQQLYNAFSKIGINNLIRLSHDDIDFYLDKDGKENDLKETLDKYDLETNEAMAADFGQLRMVLEYEEGSFKYLINVIINRSHKVGRYPIDIYIDGLFTGFQGNTEDELKEKLQNTVFISQDAYDAYLLQKQSEFEALIAKVEYELKLATDAKDIKQQQRKQLWATKGNIFKDESYTVEPKERHRQAVYHQYHGYSSDVAYMYLWASMCHNNNIHVNNTQVVSNDGDGLGEIGEKGLNAGENNFFDDSLDYNDRTDSLNSSNDFHNYTDSSGNLGVDGSSDSDAGGWWLGGDSFSDNSSSGSSCSSCSSGSSCSSCSSCGGCGGN